MGVLVSTVGEGANEEVDGVRKEKERLTTDHQLGEYYFVSLSFSSSTPLWYVNDWLIAESLGFVH